MIDGVAGVFDRDRVSGIVLAVAGIPALEERGCGRCKRSRRRRRWRATSACSPADRSRSLRPSKAPGTCRVKSRGSRSERARHRTLGAQRFAPHRLRRCRYRDGELLRCIPWSAFGCQSEADWQRHRRSRRCGSHSAATRDSGARWPAPAVTMRCVVDAGFSLRRRTAIVSPGWKHRVRNSCAVCVFIAGVSQGWKPGVYRAPELMEGKRLMRPLPEEVESLRPAPPGWPSPPGPA